MRHATVFTDNLDRAFLRHGDFLKDIGGKIVAAAILDFMDSDPNTRSKMFERLDAFLKSKKG